MSQKDKEKVRTQALISYALNLIDTQAFIEILEYTNPFKGNKNNRYSK